MGESLNEKFVCPSCKETGFLEVIIDGAVLSHLIDLSDDGYFEHKEGSGVEVLEGFTSRFQCSICGYTLTDDNGKTIDEGEGAVEWITKHS